MKTCCSLFLKKMSSCAKREKNFREDPPTWKSNGPFLHTCLCHLINRGLKSIVFVCYMIYDDGIKSPLECKSYI